MGYIIAITKKNNNKRFDGMHRMTKYITTMYFLKKTLKRFTCFYVSFHRFNIPEKETNQSTGNDRYGFPMGSNQSLSYYGSINPFRFREWNKKGIELLPHK